MKIRQAFRRLVLLGMVGTLISVSGMGCKKKASEPPVTPPATIAPTAQVVRQSTVPPTSQPPRTVIAPPVIKLKDVISSAKWAPKTIDFKGPVPDLALTDLDGKTYKLSDWRGRNVLLTFWASWCPNCKTELPQLAQLRTEIEPDKLAILAVSLISGRNPESSILATIKGLPSINYPVVATTAAALPTPFTQVEYLPCSFFIDARGEVKLVTEGMVPLDDMKKILQAQ